jgi:N-acetylmuramoyl-L-alanine amidase
MLVSDERGGRARVRPERLVDRRASATLVGASGLRRAFGRLGHPAVVLPTLERRGRKADHGRGRGSGRRVTGWAARRGDRERDRQADGGFHRQGAPGGLARSSLGMWSCVCSRTVRPEASRTSPPRAVPTSCAWGVTSCNPRWRTSSSPRSKGSPGRKVRTFLSGSSTPGESAVEVFVLEPGHGADDAGARGRHASRSR